MTARKTREFLSSKNPSFHAAPPHPVFVEEKSYLKVSEGFFDGVDEGGSGESGVCIPEFESPPTRLDG